MALTNLSQITTSGISTLADINLNNLTGVAATFTGNVTIGGTLTYDDVTNIDSVGIITARSGIRVLTGTATTALVVEGNARVTGILTVGTSSLTLNGSTNVVNVGTALTLGHTQGLQFHTQNLHSQGFDVNNVNVTGIVTAQSGIDIVGGSKKLNFDSGASGVFEIFREGSGNAYITATNQFRMYSGDRFSFSKIGGIDFLILDTTGNTVTGNTNIIGNVGIGTANPSADYRVTIKSSTSPHSALLLDTTESNYNTNLYFAKQGTNKWTIGNKADSDSFRFVAGSTERLRITSGGDLDFKSADGVGINFLESGYINIDSDNDDSNRNFSFYDAKGTGSEKRLMILTDTGNIGIGTAVPGAALHVFSSSYPTATIQRDHAVNYPRLRLSNTANDGADLDGIGDGTGGFRISTLDAGTSTERLRIDSTGRITAGKHGVGTSNDASEWFKVQSDDSAANISIVGSNDTHSTLNLGDEDDFNIQKIKSDHTNNSLQFFTADAERLRIGSGGEVRIMTANGQLKWLASSGNDPFIRSIGSGQQEIEFNTGGDERLRITSGGFIGAGTASPRRHFHIHETASATVGFQMTNAGTGASNDSQGFQLKVGSDGHAEIAQMENSNLRFFTNAAERMRIASDGKTAIGGNYTDIATFGRQLLISGTLGLNNDSGNVGMGFHRGTSNTYGYIGTGAWAVTGLNDDDFGISAGPTGDLAFGTGASGFSAKARITNDGKMGVGCTPEVDFQVRNGNGGTVKIGGSGSGATGFQIQYSNSGSTSTELLTNYRSTSGNASFKIDTGTFTVATGTSGAEKFRITSGGIVGVGTHTPSPSSLLEVNGAIRSGSGSGNLTTHAGFRQYNRCGVGVGERFIYNVFSSYKTEKSFHYYFPNGVSNQAVRIHSNRSSWWTCGFITLHATYSNQNAAGMLRYQFHHNANGTSSYGKNLVVDANIGYTSSNFGMSDSYSFKTWGSNGGSATSHALEIRHLTSTGNSLYITVEMYGGNASTYADDLYITTGHTY